ncbi:hypothetical protein NYO67_2737 [Aspergillus flavus]|nr:hypothetical protein NYO67_2737 [Aspergillus flavus]
MASVFRGTFIDLVYSRHSDKSAGPAMEPRREALAAVGTTHGAPFFQLVSTTIPPPTGMPEQ